VCQLELPVIESAVANNPGAFYILVRNYFYGYRIFKTGYSREFFKDALEGF